MLLPLLRSAHGVELGGLRRRDEPAGDGRAHRHGRDGGLLGLCRRRRRRLDERAAVQQAAPRLRPHAHPIAAAAGAAARGRGDRLLRRRARPSPARACRGRCSPRASTTSRRAASRWSTPFPSTSAPDDTKATDFYHGSLSMFVAAGFEPIATHDNVTVVRKTLALNGMGARTLLPHTLAVLYGIAIVFASLQPFSPWIPPAHDTPFWPFAPWPLRWTRFDVLANLITYVPLGHVHRARAAPRDAAAPARRWRSRAGSRCRSRWRRCRCSRRRATPTSSILSPTRLGALLGGLVGASLVRAERRAACVVGRPQPHLPARQCSATSGSRCSRCGWWRRSIPASPCSR